MRVGERAIRQPRAVDGDEPARGQSREPGELRGAPDALLRKEGRVLRRSKSAGGFAGAAEFQTRIRRRHRELYLIESAAPGRPRTLQIGRASCRERVYVLV